MRHTLFSAARTTLMSGLLALSIPAFANTNELYQLSGMQTHQEHFQQALKKAQQRYASQLPAAVADNLMRQSSERFEPNRMHARAAATSADAQLAWRPRDKCTPPCNGRVPVLAAAGLPHHSDRERRGLPLGALVGQ